MEELLPPTTCTATASTSPRHKMIVFAPQPFASAILSPVDGFDDTLLDVNGLYSAALETFDPSFEFGDFSWENTATACFDLTEELELQNLFNVALPTQTDSILSTAGPSDTTSHDDNAAVTSFAELASPAETTTFVKLEQEANDQAVSKMLPKRHRKNRRRHRRRARACELAPQELEHSRMLARSAAQRRRARWLEEENELLSAMAASEMRDQELKAEHIKLVREITILQDVIQHRWTNRDEHQKFPEQLSSGHEL